MLLSLLTPTPTRLPLGTEREGLFGRRTAEQRHSETEGLKERQRGAAPEGGKKKGAEERKERERDTVEAAGEIFAPET